MCGAPICQPGALFKKCLCSTAKTLHYTSTPSGWPSWVALALLGHTAVLCYQPACQYLRCAVC